jgi:hypothetical protein
MIHLHIQKTNRKTRPNWLILHLKLETPKIPTDHHDKFFCPILAAISKNNLLLPFLPTFECY